MAAWTSHLGTESPPEIAVRRGESRVGIDGGPVPRLRGRLHQGAVVPTAVLGIVAMLLAEGLAARRVDHATILVAIAGTQTAFWVLVGPASLTPIVIAAVWSVKGVGFVYKVRRLAEAGSNGSWLFFVLGWSGTALIPYLLTAGWLVTALVMIGGAA